MFRSCEAWSSLVKNGLIVSQKLSYPFRLKSFWGALIEISKIMVVVLSFHKGSGASCRLVVSFVTSRIYRDVEVRTAAIQVERAPLTILIAFLCRKRFGSLIGITLLWLFKYVVYFVVVTLSKVVYCDNKKYLVLVEITRV